MNYLIVRKGKLRIACRLSRRLELDAGIALAVVGRILMSDGLRISYGRLLLDCEAIALVSTT